MLQVLALSTAGISLTREENDSSHNHEQYIEDATRKALQSNKRSLKSLRQQTQEHVMSSGYWFVVCLDVQKAWDTCDPDTETTAEIVPQFQCEEGPETETPMQMQERCHSDYFEINCRNEMLNYFAHMKKSEAVYTALNFLPEFRQELHDHCRLSLQAMEGEFPFYQPQMNAEMDELLQALRGADAVQKDDSGELDQYKVTKPVAWKKKDQQSEFDFDTALLTPHETVTIEGQYSTDLDLFYTEDDVTRLFSYVSQDYAQICDIALQSLHSQNDPETLKQLNDELLTLHYNYLSEDSYTRDTLYYVCAFDTHRSEEDQRLLHEERDKFNNLFT